MGAYMVLGLDGGKKKKKKKAFTTKRKTKHKHKYEKLAVLGYYKVEGSTAKTTRKHCPQCGPAFHMAQHYDRHYCGFCHLTLRVDPELAKQRKKELDEKHRLKKLNEPQDKPKAADAKGKKAAKKGKKKL